MDDGPATRLDGGLNARTGMGAGQGPASATEAELRRMWEHIATRAASRGRGSDEQLAGELADALPRLSHALALGDGQDALAVASRFVLRLRQAGEAAGALRDASDPLAEAWVALLREEAERWFLAACGRTDWGTGEWLGVPRVAHGVKDRVSRLRALGNAVVPQIPEMIGRAILEAENVGSDL
jgi:hypothetical protein